MSSVRRRPFRHGETFLADAVDDLIGVGTGVQGALLVCASAATLRTARSLLRYAPRLVALHDAGVGKDNAGIAGLERLDDVHLPALAVRHDSARMHDADDLLDHGEVAHLNEAARAEGFREGPLRAQVESWLERQREDANARTVG